MTPTPLLFLDIDGVLNRMGPAFPRARASGGRGARLWLPEGTAERVGALLEHFDPVWASAWRRGAHKALAPELGLSGPPWPYLPYGSRKLEALIRYANERPWAWVDDEAAREVRGSRTEPTGLILIPDAGIGLTDEHVETLIAFARPPGDKIAA